jgi:hypothetical protein
LSAPADCWLRNIVSFEPKPVVKAVISTLLKDGYNLETLRNYGLPHKTANQIIPLLSKPVYDHMDVNYHDRSSNPHEVGHHIYADHATWVTPDGVFHENSSTEAHQIEARYPGIPLEKDTLIGGILDLIESANKWKKSVDLEFIEQPTIVEEPRKLIEALSTEDLTHFALSDHSITFQRKSRNMRARNKSRIKRQRERLTNFFAQAERAQAKWLGKSNGNNLAILQHSQLLQAESKDEILSLINAQKAKFQQSSYGKFVDDEPLDHSDIGSYTNNFDPTPIPRPPKQPNFVKEIIDGLQEINAPQLDWLYYNYENGKFSYRYPLNYGHEVSDGRINIDRNQISCLDYKSASAIKQRFFYKCHRCEVELDSSQQPGLHASVCQSIVELTSTIQSRSCLNEPLTVAYHGPSNSVAKVTLHSSSQQSPNLGRPVDRNNFRLKDYCRNTYHIKNNTIVYHRTSCTGFKYVLGKDCPNMYLHPHFDDIPIMIDFNGKTTYGETLPMLIHRIQQNEHKSQDSEVSRYIKLQEKTEYDRVWTDSDKHEQTPPTPFTGVFCIDDIEALPPSNYFTILQRALSYIHNTKQGRSIAVNSVINVACFSFKFSFRETPEVLAVFKSNNIPIEYHSNMEFLNDSSIFTDPWAHTKGQL